MSDEVDEVEGVYEVEQTWDPTTLFLYKEADAEAFLDDLLDTPDGWFRFVEQHRKWGFDDTEAAEMIRSRSRGRYIPTAEHMVVMRDTQLASMKATGWTEGKQGRWLPPVEEPPTLDRVVL